MSSPNASALEEVFGEDLKPYCSGVYILERTEISEEEYITLGEKVNGIEAAASDSETEH
jgi:hypothetical protein